MPDFTPTPPSLPPPPDRIRTLLWITGLGALAWLVWLLRPMLTPFLTGAILAYIFDPAVGRLERHGLPRTVSVILVILGFGLLITLLVLILTPLIHQETLLISERAPGYIAYANKTVMPWFKRYMGVDMQLDLNSLRQLLTDNPDGASDVAGRLLSSLRVGGLAVMGILLNLVLVPVVMFFLMRDWNHMLAHIDTLIPRPWHDRTARVLGEIDRVMAEFLRGQLSVMTLLAGYYCIGLWIAGLEFFLPVGLITGLLVFIPYVGFGIGFILALFTGLMQFEGWGLIIGVLIVYGVGNMLEGFLLTPFLVGERIGLHPLAVIFALLAFAQLFGFVGVLLALPLSAALLVWLREVRSSYLASRLYKGG